MKGKEASHVAELAIGGKARRSPNLRALPPEPEMPEGWEMVDGVPPNRDACRNGVRPCPYVKCELHLWMIDARDRPGRRHENGAGPRSTLQASTMHTCERDLIEHARRVRPPRPDGTLMTNDEIGEVLGCSDERVRQVLQSARAKLKAQGVELDTLVAGALEAA